MKKNQIHKFSGKNEYRWQKLDTFNSFNTLRDLYLHVNVNVILFQNIEIIH